MFSYPHSVHLIIFFYAPGREVEASCRYRLSPDYCDCLFFLPELLERFGIEHLGLAHHGLGLEERGFGRFGLQGLGLLDLIEETSEGLGRLCMTEALGALHRIVQ